MLQQILLAEQKQGLQKLDEAVQQGEKLYPDTSAAGRESIRKQLRTAKDIWDTLVADMTESQRRFDTSITLWSAYREGAEQLDKWLLEVETWLKSDTELKNTLPEKRSQLQNNKVGNYHIFQKMFIAVRFLLW